MSNFRITPNALSHKLKLHQLQIFERVLARRSLSRAASEMHLTQPTVTKAIHDLEAFFGATLFERSNRGVTPTELALVLGRRVHAMMAEIRYMADDIDAVLGGASGHVVVGTLIAASAAAARGHRAADDRASRHPGHGARGPVGAAAAGAGHGRRRHRGRAAAGRRHGLDLGRGRRPSQAVPRGPVPGGRRQPSAGRGRAGVAGRAGGPHLDPARPTSPLRARSSAASSTPACACPRVTSNRCRC